jgi:hypothetical protein
MKFKYRKCLSTILDSIMLESQTNSEKITGSVPVCGEQRV